MVVPERSLFCFVFLTCVLELSTRERVDGDWEGFPGELAESIKGIRWTLDYSCLGAFRCRPVAEASSFSFLASYAERSYHGAPEFQCRHCGAIFWWAERVKSTAAAPQRRVEYSLCCKGGKVYVPPFKKPPPFLADLLHFDGDRRAKRFVSKIRQYNCLFSFTSMGANIDRSINQSYGPNIFKIQGAVCHRMGSLLPAKSDAPGSVGGKNPPKFAELYIYDTTNEVSNRISAINPDKGRTQC